MLEAIDQGSDGRTTGIQFKYKKPRRCLQALCQFEAEDAADMFKHVRQVHVKSIN